MKFISQEGFNKIDQLIEGGREKSMLLNRFFVSLKRFQIIFLLNYICGGLLWLIDPLSITTRKNFIKLID